MAIRRTPEELLRDAAKDTAVAHMEMAKAALKADDLSCAAGQIDRAKAVVEEILEGSEKD